MTLPITDIRSEVSCNVNGRILIEGSYGATRRVHEKSLRGARQSARSTGHRKIITLCPFASLHDVLDPLAVVSAGDSGMIRERRFLEDMKARIDERLRVLDQLQVERTTERRIHTPEIAIGQTENPRTYTVRNRQLILLYDPALMMQQHAPLNTQNRDRHCAESGGPFRYQKRPSPRAQKAIGNAKTKLLGLNRGRPSGDTCIRCKFQKLKVCIYVVSSS